jgi:hypothetical protein
MENPQEAKKIAMRKYQKDFYENNKERIKEDKLISYYKREYGLNFLTREQLQSFRDNKNIYLALLDTNELLDKDIIRSIYNMKYVESK